MPGVLPPGYAPDGHDGHNLPGQIPQNKKQAYKRRLISLHLSSPPSLFGMAQPEHRYAFLSNYTTILFAIIVRCVLSHFLEHLRLHLNFTNESAKFAPPFPRSFTLFVLAADILSGLR